MNTKVEFLYLNEEDMIEAGVLNMENCMETLEDAVKLLSAGDFIMGGDGNSHGLPIIFPKDSAIENFPINDSRDKRFMAMPAYLGGRFHLMGQKWYGSNGKNSEKGLPRSILMVTLNDVDTGKPLAYLSGNLLSAMRTGAMPGVAAKHLVRKDAKVIALIGAGVVNKTCLMAYMTTFKEIETIKILGRSPSSLTAKKMEQFIRENYPHVSNITICENLEEAVRDADIISEAVSTPFGKWPVFDNNWFKPGCVLISSGTMEMADMSFMEKNMTKVVDHLPMYKEYVEALQKYDEKTGEPIPRGILGMYFYNMVASQRVKDSEIKRLGDIVNKTTKARTSEEEMFMVCVGGMPILDVGWGYDCYKSALEKGIGTKLKLWDSPYLY